MATAAFALVKKWLGGTAPCMRPTWEVVAVWMPPAREVVKYLQYSIERAQVIPPGAGAEFKFKVIAADTTEAIEIVRKSRFFSGNLSKEFGFCAKEVAA